VKFSRRHVGPLVALALILASGCASSKRDLAARDYWPSGARWKQAATRAVKDRGTWIPLAGAAVVGGVDDWDRQISDWAVENTPVFGSRDNAVEASDTLWLATQLAMAGTALAVPNGPGAWEWKPERLLIEVSAVLLTDGMTGGLKRLSNRERPDGSNTNSFPSGHSSQAFTQARMAGLNVDDLPALSRGWRITLKTTFTTMAAATAWARVEGGKHYPSDVLFGAALGNFIAIFVHDAFLPAKAKTQFNATLSRNRFSFSVARVF